MIQKDSGKDLKEKYIKYYKLKHTIYETLDPTVVWKVESCEKITVCLTATACSTHKKKVFEDDCHNATITSSLTMDFI